ncbi:MAG: APC family permease [Acidobacteria bacterium]|nr:APC family permease [Acidobacteriota bacterium]
MKVNEALPRSQPTQVVVATTVLLSFFSFWRAAAIVLGDLGSSAFYAGGIAEQAVGRAAPWFILGVMSFAWVVRAIYIESSVMFVRGGVYRVVKEAMGGTMAKLSVSALLFDYVLTGPISAVSAGLYLMGLAGEVLARFGIALPIPRDNLAAVFAVLVIIYFWWRNTQGLHESSSDALHIMYITTVMVVILLGWSIVTLLMRGGSMPPLPVSENFHFTDDALGWLKDTRFPAITAIALIIGFGHSFLAMSGYESLAQVYREIESPKPLNLRRTGVVVFVYALVFTGSVSFLAAALIPDAVRPQFYDNLISGIAMHLVGPLSLRLLFQAFVVVVGVLMLASAVNTAIVGSNAVLNRVSEDGVLPEWFRQPHKRYGTTHRFLNLIVGLQLLTVLLSGGHIYILGEAYAFGVIWSFAFKALAVLVLRFRSPGEREWRVPLNLKVGSVELPIGLAAITMALFSVAVVNLFTKQVATISGSIFTLLVYGAFVWSERVTARKRAAQALHGHPLDQFQLLPAPDVGLAEVAARAGNVLVPVRDPNTLAHLKWVLNHTDTDKRDIVVMTARLLQGPDTGYRDLALARLFADYEQTLFTKVVAVAEREGRPVKLLVVPSTNASDAIAQTAVRLQSTEIVVGESAKISGAQMALMLGEAWDRIDKDRDFRSRLVVCQRSGALEMYQLGLHVPPLTPEDLELIHKLWLDAVAKLGLQVHHRDVVRTAIEELAGDLSAGARDRAVDLIARNLGRTTEPADRRQNPPGPV